MGQSHIQKDQKQSRAIENFLYFVSLTLAIVIVPYVLAVTNSLTNSIWVKTIIGLFTAIILILLVELSTKYLKRTKFFSNYTGSLTWAYIIYSVIYIIVRSTLDI